MSQRTTAQRENDCRACDRRITRGDLIRKLDGERGPWVHAHCSNDADRDDREYGLGVMDAEQSKFERDTFGEDYAAAEEYSRYLRFGDD